MQQLQRGTDWYDLVCQQLDALREDARRYPEPDTIVPEDGFFELVKTRMQDFRRLAGNPAIPTPDVWLGPNGEIGLTWDAGERSFELVFSPTQFTARLSVDLDQQLLDTQDVPLVLAQLAA